MRLFWSSWVPWVCIPLAYLCLLAPSQDRIGSSPLDALTNDPVLTKDIKAPVPQVQQLDSDGCGAACTLSVTSRWGVGKRTFAEVEREVRTTKANGTLYEDIVHYCKSLGLHVEVHDDIAPADLRLMIDKGHNVICSIQAYGNPATYDKNKNGHDVVAVGWRGNWFYFMDPSMPGAWGELFERDLLLRWHDDEGTRKHPDVIKRFGLEIWGDGQSGVRSRRIP
jgi:predicted double-glycine peptidase